MFSILFKRAPLVSLSRRGSSLQDLARFYHPNRLVTTPTPLNRPQLRFCTAFCLSPDLVPMAQSTPCPGCSFPQTPGFTLYITRGPTSRQRPGGPETLLGYPCCVRSGPQGSETVGRTSATLTHSQRTNPTQPLPI